MWCAKREPSPATVGVIVRAPMSFYADPVILFADGELFARLPESAQGRAAQLSGGLAVGAMLTAGIGSYLDLPWTKRLWKPFGAKNGTDFMLAWPFAHGKRRRRSPRTDALAAVIFAAYPLSWWLGWDHGRRRRPRAAS
jgi:hypothetical protein